MGRHFLQIPGPSPEPDRVLREISRTTIDHRGPEFAELGLAVLEGTRSLFGTEGDVVIYSSSGTGAWEAALVNAVHPGGRVLFYVGGHFASQWARMAQNLGYLVDVLEGDWRRGIDTHALQQHLEADTDGKIEAVCCVHNETSTGTLSDISAVRAAIDGAGHDALLLVDTISGLGSVEYKHDGWGVDVSIAGSQKGMMLPPGLGFNAVSQKALDRQRSMTGVSRHYWDWNPILAANKRGFWPTTPSTNLLFGLRESLAMLEEETLTAVYRRHERLAGACRAAVAAWGLELWCTDAGAHSPVVTAVKMPEGTSSESLRKRALDDFDVSIGAGLGPMKDIVFRIGHLGWINDATLFGALAAIELSLRRDGVPINANGVQAAMESIECADVH